VTVSSPRRVQQRDRLLWVGWIVALFTLVAGLTTIRDYIAQTHVVMLLLLVVLGASATIGFAAGVTIAVLAFAMLSYFFQLPRNTVDVPSTPDLIELVTFLLVAVVAARLLTIARQRAKLAEDRAVEIVRLAEGRAALESAAREA
jgi:K+-sensing histidine kinase KdpD